MHHDRSQRLADDVRFDVVYDDRTPLGSMVSGHCERRIRERCAAIVEHRRRYGLAATVAASERLLDAAMRDGCLGDWCDAAGVPRPKHVFPDPAQTVPVALRVEGPRAVHDIALAPSLTRDLARWMGDWQRGQRTRPRCGPARDLWRALAAVGALTRDERPARVDGDMLFVGHATVRIGPRGGTALFDPFLLPRDRGARPSDYQPLVADELRPDAIFVTHSHPDHYDLGSLLRFGAEMPIHVPSVERESILSVDMASRLGELGFLDVRTVAPFSETNVGGTRVVTLPFHGEQPTRDERHLPDVRNVGATYWVEADGRRFALVADAGTDGRGSVQEIAALARQHYGAVDAVFGGYRSWAIYPLRYLFSSVARYLLFVPRSRWLVRQRIMNDADDLLDVAEIWGARAVVPYADGGAPWYWRRGLGPRLDRAGADNEHIDPRPERVRHAARNRSACAEGAVSSNVAVAVLRPGEALSPSLGVLAPGRGRWPFALEACA